MKIQLVDDKGETILARGEKRRRTGKKAKERDERRATEIGM